MPSLISSLWINEVLRPAADARRRASAAGPEIGARKSRIAQNRKALPRSVLLQWHLTESIRSQESMLVRKSIYLVMAYLAGDYVVSEIMSRVCYPTLQDDM